MKDTTVKTTLFAEDAGDYRRTWVWAVPFLVFAFFLAGQIAALLPLKPFDIFTKDNIETYPYIIYMLVGAFGMVAIIVFAWVKYFERRSLKSIGLGVDADTKTVFGRGFVQGIVMGSLIVLGVFALGGYSVEAEASLTLGDLAPIFILMLCFIVQSGVEEIVFRGWMLNRIAAKYGFWVGALGNSTVFALMHIDDSVTSMTLANGAIFVSMTMLFSIFLSLMVRHDKSVWGACAWHASWNWLFITWWGLPTTGIELGLKPLVMDLMPTEGAAKWLTGGAMGPEDSIVAVVIMTAGTLYYLMKKERSPAN